MILHEDQPSDYAEPLTFLNTYVLDIRKKSFDDRPSMKTFFHDDAYVKTYFPDNISVKTHIDHSASVKTCNCGNSGISDSRIVIVSPITSGRLITLPRDRVPREHL